MLALYIIAGLLLANCLSWSLIPAYLVPKSKLPTPTLLRQHEDWPKPFRWINRRLSSFITSNKCNRGAPIQLLGSNPAEHPQDVPAPGTWCLSWPLHFAVRTKSDLLLALGIRYDYFDHGYYTLRLTGKRVRYNDEMSIELWRKILNEFDAS